MENEQDMKEGNDVADANGEGEGVDHGLVEQEDDQEGQGTEDRPQRDADAVDDRRDVARDEDEGVDVGGDHLPAGRLRVDKFPDNPAIEDAFERTFQTRKIHVSSQLYPPALRPLSFQNGDCLFHYYQKGGVLENE